MNDSGGQRFGAHLDASGRAVFRIWAPDVEALEIELEGSGVLPLLRLADGWFQLDAQSRAGARYRYILPDGTAVPDPASRAQDGDVHDHSVLVDPTAYRWQNPNWQGRPWKETVIYEVHVGLAGGFAGVTEKLAGLKALGVTAIELMPIADFPGPRNWGYDGVLPFAPDAAYGSPDALRLLVDTAHGLGLSVFLDVVYNHFGPEGNYLPKYASGFFRDDLVTPWGSALDFRHPQVRDFFTENVLYWLRDFRFDGLRLDAVHAIADAGWLDGLPMQVRSAFPEERLIHLVVENDDNEARLLGAGFAAQWNDDIHHVLHVLLIGETDGYYADYADAPARRLARCLEEGFAYQGEASAHRGGAARGTPSAHLSPLSFVAFLQNHDQVGNRALGERLPALAKPRALEAAMALLLLAPWIPMLFMGEERASETPFFYFASYDGELADAVREGRRREFARFPAFASPDAQASIPDPNSTATFERSRPDLGSAAATANESRMLRLVGHLLQLRREVLIPLLDDVQSVSAQELGQAAVSSHWQLSQGRWLSLYVNLAQDDQAVPPDQRPSSRAPLFFEGSVGALAALVSGTLPGETAIALLGDADPRTGLPTPVGTSA